MLLLFCEQLSDQVLSIGRNIVRKRIVDFLDIALELVKFAHPMLEGCFAHQELVDHGTQ